MLLLSESKTFTLQSYQYFTKGWQPRRWHHAEYKQTIGFVRCEQQRCRVELQNFTHPDQGKTVIGEVTFTIVLTSTVRQSCTSGSQNTAEVLTYAKELGTQLCN